MEIIDGRKLSKEILDTIKKEVSALSFQPIFCDVLVGRDPASVQYVEMKKRIAESVGISFHASNFPVSITTEKLIEEIKILNQMQNMCGIIVQLPLPSHLDRSQILDAIDPKLDVDCLGTVCSKKFYSGETPVRGGFPTAQALMFILDSLNLDLSSKNIVVLGQGMLVGKPVTALLKSRGLSAEVIDIETENKEEIIKNGEVIISGIGQGKYLVGSMVKEGVIIIDAGTSESNGSIVGDVDLHSMEGIASYITPAPGGVGPVTVAMLLKNVLAVAKSLY